MAEAEEEAPFDVDSEGEAVEEDDAETLFFEDTTGDGADYDGPLATAAEPLPMDTSFEVEVAGAEEDPAAATEYVAEAANVDDDAVFVVDAGGDEDFFIDVAGDAEDAAMVSIDEVVVTGEASQSFEIDVVGQEALQVASPADAPAEPAPGGELFGALVAESFSVDLDCDLATPGSPAVVAAAAIGGGGSGVPDDVAAAANAAFDKMAAEIEALAAAQAEMEQALFEPPTKRQKLEDAAADLAAETCAEDIPDSPLAESLPDNLDDMGGVPVPAASPAFKAPRAKWSGVPRPPGNMVKPPTSRALPKVFVNLPSFGGVGISPAPLGSIGSSPAVVNRMVAPMPKAGGVRPPRVSTMAPMASARVIGGPPASGLRSSTAGLRPPLTIGAAVGRPPQPSLLGQQRAAEGPRPSDVPPPVGAGGAAPVESPTPGATKPAWALDEDAGYVFACNNFSVAEMARRKLFGCQERELQQMKQGITISTRLFLMNLDSLKMWGPFAPNSEPELHIERGAFNNRFNAQIRVLPSDNLIETQLERKIPTGVKDPSGMRLIQDFLDKGQTAPITVLKMWGVVAGGPPTPSPTPFMVGLPRPTPLMQSPTVAALAIGAGAVAKAATWMSPMNRGGIASPKAFGMTAPCMINPMNPMMSPIIPPMGFRPPGQGEARTDKYVPGCDKEGRPYNLSTVVVNFCNVGASYAKKVRNVQKGDRLFDWEGVRKCVRGLTQELGLQVVGCIVENYWGPDNGGPQRPIPEDVRAMCISIQETPSLTGKNHKSADDEMTIKCAWRRNCRFMDNDNYRDWLREMRDNRVRKWLENTQEMLQMRYYFDSDLGTFDTLDGNVPVGLLAEVSTQRALMSQ